PERGQAAVDLADDVDPAPVQAEDLHGDDPGEDRGQGAGHHRGQGAQAQDQGQGGQADGQGQPLGVAEVAQQPPELLEEVTARALDPEQLGQLTGDDGQGKPDDEALEHGLGDEAGQEPEAQQPGQQGRDPGGDGQGRRQLDEL